MTTPVVGDVVDEVAFPVEAGKIREFTRATRTTDRRHTDPAAAHAAGFTDVLATATHVMVCGHHRDQGAMIAKLGLALERVVVGTVRWRYRRPLVAGDRLHGTRRIVGDETRSTSKGTLRVITLATDFRDDTGESVVELIETVLEKGLQG
ncbi:FAS1-like dehydratase domain-containing protein [Labedaea rhizosphaerae]|uniref:MaoC dehydratase-like protein n=1 Tax=Labedaea rhizosphaerae TaxID=598644 RepID=A0A4R6RYE3_LABRH|nr:MaoC family dehydratase N-terminal domain-containing protein [Labedaea rhizosphaerae]TDP91884.1 MaoC dehydratase-like protein [Labedaea rhizosphaerae]